MKGRKNIFKKLFPGSKNISKFFICSYFLAFGLAENNASAAASTVYCSSSAHLGAVRTTLNGRPSAIKYRDYYLQRRRAAALNNRWKVQ